MEKLKHFKLHCTYHHISENGDCTVCQHLNSFNICHGYIWKCMWWQNSIKFSHAHNHSRWFKSPTVSETNSYTIIRTLILEPWKWLIWTTCCSCLPKKTLLNPKSSARIPNQFEEHAVYLQVHKKSSVQSQWVNCLLFTAKWTIHIQFFWTECMNMSFCYEILLN